MFLKLRIISTMPVFQETSTCLFLKSETLKILVLFQMISQEKFLDEMEKKKREKGNKGIKKKGSSRTQNDDICDDDNNEMNPMRKGLRR